MEKCRACLASNCDIKFLKEDDTINFNDLTKLSVQSNDGLPQYLCNHCHSVIMKFIAFRTLCSNSDKTLRQIMEEKIIQADYKNQDTDANVKYEIVFVEDDYLHLDIKLESTQGTSEPEIKIKQCNSRKTKNCDPNDNKVNSDHIETKAKPNVIITCGKPGSKDWNSRQTMKFEPTHDKIDEKNIETKPNTEVLPCGLCNEEFSEQIDLKKHLESHQDNLYCSLCFKNHFTVWPQLLSHRVNNLPKRWQMLCHLCWQPCLKDYILEQHYYKHHFDDKLPGLHCKPCNKVFFKLRTYRLHMRQHNIDYQDNVGAYICDICAKVFHDKSRIATHLQSHGTERKFYCKKCYVIFKTQEGLRSHFLSKHTAIKYKCEVCDSRFKTESTLDKHIFKNNCIKIYICPVCGKINKSSGALNAHRQTHDLEKRFKCSICPKSFPTRYKFQVHMDRHSGVKRFACCYCPFMFHEKIGVQKHERTHTGDRPYQCEECGRGFITNYNRKLHMKKHGINLLQSKKKEDNNQDIFKHNLIDN